MMIPDSGLLFWATLYTQLPEMLPWPSRETRHDVTRMKWPMQFLQGGPN